MESESVMFDGKDDMTDFVCHRVPIPTKKTMFCQVMLSGAMLVSGRISMDLSGSGTRW